MGHHDIVLPYSIELSSLQITLQALKFSDRKFYLDIYTNPELMRYINDDIDAGKVKSDFQLIVNETNQIKPKYISYSINHHTDQMGILGIKNLSADELEIGMILRHQFQQSGWSKRIKTALIPYMQETLNAHQLVAYCKHDNGAENHVNASLGFKIRKQFNHRTRKYLMNKWVLDSSATSNHENGEIL